MKLQRIGVVVVSAAMLLLQNVSAQLLESWEGTLDGWTVQQAAYAYAPSTKFGVTDQTYSAALTGTASPTYGQMLLSPFVASWTPLLANAGTISLDIFTPPASFGFFLQFDIDLNNADAGFTSIDGFSYPATVIGSEYTWSYAIPAAYAAALAASSNPTQIAIQIGGGFSDGNETMYLDNLRVTPIPEPSTIALLGLSLVGLIGLARRRVS